MPDLTLNSEPPGTKNAYWMATVVLGASWGLTKGDLRRELSELGIETRPFFHPLSSLPAYRGQEQAALAQKRAGGCAYDLSPRAVNLPSALCLTGDQVRRVCDSLKSVLNKHRR